MKDVEKIEWIGGAEQVADCLTKVEAIYISNKKGERNRGKIEGEL